jgi:hypothetical protein
MSNLRCKDCKSTDVTVYTPGTFGDSRHRCNSCGKISFTANFVEPTLFDRITSSPEVLAPEFVEPYTCWGENGQLETRWRTNFRELSGMLFDTREEAIAATLEELNKVSK